MSDPIPRPADTYSPLYFLAALGAGGLVVTFFMYLMFWVPHPGQPVPVFEDLMRAFSSGNTALSAAIVIALIGIAVFAVMNVTTLIWNLRAFSSFRQSAAYEGFANSNAESTQLAMPLALAMTVNVLFIVGLVFVPGLWSIVEYLFPMAMIAFLAIGILAFRQLGRFLGRVLTQPDSFDMKANNSFAQVLPAFALSMIGVGLAAPAAMSTLPVTSGIAVVLSTLFATIAVLYAVAAGIIGLNSMLQNGTAREAAPTLMVIVPLITVLGILALRQTHGVHMIGDAHGASTDKFVLLTRLLTVQLAFVGLGWLVMARQRYFDDFVFGSKTSPGSYALVCPGVALSVMIHFWANKGLVGAGLIDKFSPAFWSVTAIALILQFAMIALVLRLNRQHFGRPAEPALVPGE